MWPVVIISYRVLSTGKFSFGKFSFLTNAVVLYVLAFIHRFIHRYWYSNSVRLFVHPSVVRPSVRDTLVLYENGLTYRHSFFTYGSSIIFFLRASNNVHEIPTASSPAGALNTGGVYKFRDFLPISRCISQTIQDIAIITIEGE